MKNRIGFLRICAIGILSAAAIDAATYSISVNAASDQGALNRFYEQCVGTCHPITVLRSSYRRNIQNAIARGRAEAGFMRIRNHGIFNSDIGIYSVNSAGTPVYNWARFDSIYDVMKANGMHGIVELSHMPPALASSGQSMFWYNGAPGNVSPPKDYTKWRDLVKETVLHCEQRYGVDEVRKNWYFEAWNEPDVGGFWGGTWAEYLKLYDYSAEGVRLADSLVRVGGPACSGYSPERVDLFLKHITSETNAATGKPGIKCDFLSYHRYSGDMSCNGGRSMPKSLICYHKSVADVAKTYNFTGEILCTEWSPQLGSSLHSDEESSASCMAKTIQMLMDMGPGYPPPTAYSFWVLSDIFEEWDARPATALKNEEFGLMMRGDPAIPASFDMPKAVFNAYKLLHRLGDRRVALTGGTTLDGVNGLATVSANKAAVQVLLFNHVDGGGANSANQDDITLAVAGVPFTSAIIEQYMVDRTRSNPYRTWQSLGSPPAPTAAQWTQMKAVAELTRIDSSAATITGGTFSKAFKLNTYSVTLLTIRDRNAVAVAPQQRLRPAGATPALICRGTTLSLSLPDNRGYNLRINAMDGRTILRAHVPGDTWTCAKRLFAPAAYMISARPEKAAGSAGEVRLMAVIR